MPEILIIPSRATRASYPLHLRIVCAIVSRLADLQVSLQHAHTARLVRNFPARYPAIETLAASAQLQQEQLQNIAARQGCGANCSANVGTPSSMTQEEEDFQRMRAEVAQQLEDALNSQTPRN